MNRSELIYGIHSVQSLLKASPQRFLTLYAVKQRRDQKMQKLLDIAQRERVTTKLVDKKFLDTLCSGNHQGIAAEVKPGKAFQEKDLYVMLDELSVDPLLLVLDGVTDPHNLGACLRSADAAGVNAVIIPKDNSAGLNETARKVASGAAENIMLVVVTNLARCLRKLQENRVWITGLAGEAESTAYQADLRGRRAIVMGAEGSGMRRLTREHCDELVSIPMNGTVSSLNVSVATGVILFEALRQRSFPTGHS